MKKAIVIEKENGKRIVFTRQSDAMMLVLRILAALNIVTCVLMTFNKDYIFAFLNLNVSFFTYQISCNIERNNEIYDFFDNENENTNQ